MRFINARCLKGQVEEMSNGKKRFTQVQHLLLSEDKRKEARKHGKRNILQIPKRKARKNDK